ncbi:MAG: hypothetical protein Q7K33_02975, partial [Candidatus Berkelbacteria bacterium]|nr:hypothetical protein [Candidatus Berkelbacteria bacterium]
RINAEEERYVRAYGAGALEFVQFRKLINELKRHKSKATSDLEEASAKSNQPSRLPSPMVLCQEVKEVLRNLATADRTRLVNDLISRIVIGEDKMADVWAHIPVPALNVGEKHEYGNRRVA